MALRNASSGKLRQLERAYQISLAERTHALSWLAPCVVALVFVGLAVWSWRKWPDPLVDFGRELYTPWQLAEGKVLYRDVGSLFGPLSQYWNAVLFKILGVSLTTLIFANLGILAVMTAVLYEWLDSVSDRLTATASSVIMLTLFCFSQYVGIANYNFVCPYSHEATHGIALSIAMIYFLYRWAGRENPWYGALSGVCLGLVLLTKTELGVAAGTAAVAGIFVGSLRGLERVRLLHGVASFVVGALLPGILFFVYFCFEVSPLDAARFVLTGWRTLLSGEAFRTAFYFRLMGLDAPLSHVVQAVKIFSGIALFTAAALLLDVLCKRVLKYSDGLCVIPGAVLFIILLFLDRIPWIEIGQPLPILVLTVLGFMLALYSQGGGRLEPNGTASFCSLFAWGIFSLALLGKVFLNVRLSHYGFYLALPATIFVVVGFLWVIPNLVARKWNGGVLFKGLTIAALGALVVFHLRASNQIYGFKTLELGQDGDRFLVFRPEVDIRGFALRRALRLIDEVVPWNASLVVLPEGVMLNYLSRRVNPTPFISFVVPELRQTGEANIVSGFESTPPDFVVLVHVDTSSYGVGFFGKDPSYGKTIMTWIDQHYEQVALIGNPPLQNRLFGIKLLGRRH